MVKHKKKQIHSKHSKKTPKKPAKTPAKSQTWLWVVVVAVVIALAAFALSGVFSPDDSSNTDLNDKTSPTELSPSEGAAKLDIYVMSQCPYGTQVENAIKPVLEKLGNNLDFNVNYIVNENAGTFQSLHGEKEVQGDIVQLCAAKYNPNKYTDMIVCQNKNAGAIPDNWEECATGLDVEKIKTCYEGDEGKKLLSESIKKSNAVNAQGSPTIYINNEKYQGGRGENDFLRAVCNAYDGTKPAACADIPEPAKVNTILINDKRCAECDATKLIASLKSIFPGLDVVEYDYSDEEGKKIFTDSNLKLLPAILFDDSVKKAENYASVEKYLDAAGSLYSLKIGAKFDPTAEICDNGIDDTGNGDVDCDDSTCKDKMECREEKGDNLQVFVMSACPYGKKAIVALNEVSDNFGDNMDFEVHYIANENGDGFSSLHGQYEVDEDMIQLCVKKHSPKEWLDYIVCRSKNGVKGVDWKTCAQSTGVDIDAVSKCFDEGEGADLLREDIKIANGLGIGASPTWLANNRFTFSGIDAETVKTEYCKYNKDVSGCANTLSESTTTITAASGSCG